MQGPFGKPGSASAEITVREATPADNDALIALELECPLEMGDITETYDRSPDFFACHRHKSEWRVVIGEIEGRAVGVMTGVVQTPLIQGNQQTIMYVQQARVHPDFHGRKVAWAMANDLFAWARERAAAGPYYLISPKNVPSIAFVERGGGRWPVDVSILSFKADTTSGLRPQPVPDHQLPEAARMVNATHDGQDFFQPLTADTLAARSRWAPLFGVAEGAALVAIAGLWDRGAATARVQRDRDRGVETRSREAAVTDWGWAPGHGEAFASLLGGLASEARALGRDSLTICEPFPGAFPSPALASHCGNVALFTPGLQPPPRESIKGVFIDMLYI